MNASLEFASIDSCGNYYWPHLPDHPSNKISLEHIANALSWKQRFNGSISESCTVLNHTLFMAALSKYVTFINSSTLLAVLLHDSQEAYLTDAPGPSRQLLKYDDTDWLDLENAWQKKITNALLPTHATRDHYYIHVDDDLIKAFDNIALSVERQLFLPDYGQFVLSENIAPTFLRIEETCCCALCKQIHSMNRENSIEKYTSIVKEVIYDITQTISEQIQFRQGQNYVNKIKTIDQL